MRSSISRISFCNLSFSRSNFLEFARKAKACSLASFFFFSASFAILANFSSSVSFSLNKAIACLTSSFICSDFAFASEAESSNSTRFLLSIAHTFCISFTLSSIFLIFSLNCAFSLFFFAAFSDSLSASAKALSFFISQSRNFCAKVSMLFNNKVFDDDDDDDGCCRCILGIVVVAVLVSPSSSSFSDGPLFSRRCSTYPFVPVFIITS